MASSYIKVHRYRFGNFCPSPVKAIAVDPHSSLIAIGREDGEIELYNSDFKWYRHAKITGREEFKLQSLTWARWKEEEGRLFGISLRGFIFEADIENLSTKLVSDTYGGAAWSLASSPRDPHFIVGCEDGTARVFTCADGVLDYFKTYPTVGSRILSVEYHPNKPKLFFGCADGIIRCLDEATGRSLFRMTGDVVRGMSNSIFCLKVLSDSTVVTGDSRGNLQMWDGDKGVLLLTIHQHEAEILAIAVSADENQLFASGVDSRVTSVHRLQQQQQQQQHACDAANSAWVYSTAHRPHSHDVYALAVCHRAKILVDAAGLNKDMSTPTFSAVLLSGGLDCKLCCYSVSDFARTRPTWVLPVPPQGLVHASTDQTVLAFAHRMHVDIWDVCPAEIGESLSRPQHPVDLGLRLSLKGPEYITCTALSPDGSNLLVSRRSGTGLWTVLKNARKVGDSSNKSRVASVELPQTVKSCCILSAAFSADSRRLALYSAAAGGKIFLLDISSAQSLSKSTRSKADKTNDIIVAPARSVSVWHVFQHYNFIEKSTLTNDGRCRVTARLSVPVRELQFSADGSYLSASDCQNRVYIYDIDRLRIHWRLPPCVHPVSCTRFLPQQRGPLPSTAALLLVTMASNGILTFDIDAMSLSSWSTKHARKVGPALRKLSGPIEAACLLQGSLVALHGQGFLVLVDYDKPLPELPRTRVITASSMQTRFRRTDRRSGRKRVRDAGGGEEAVDDIDEQEETAASGEEIDLTLRSVVAGEDGNGTETAADLTVLEIYRSIVHVGCSKDKELVILENPWMRILESLPGTFARKRYGT